jgi:hypothetical protein
MMRGLAAWVLLGWAAFGCEEKSGPVAVPANRSPEILAVTCTPATTRIGRPVTIAVLARDPDGDALDYQYRVDAGRLVGSGATVLWIPPEAIGNFAVEHAVAAVAVLEATRVVGSLWSFDGMVGRARVAIYHDWGALLDDRFTQAVEAEPGYFQTRFLIDVLKPGRYWLDAWRDSNGDGCLDGGDLYAWYNDHVYYDDAWFEVVDGQTLDIGSLSLRLVEGPAWCPPGAAKLP